MNLSFTLGAERDPHVGAEAAAQRVLDATHFGRLAQSLLEARAPPRRERPRGALPPPALHGGDLSPAERLARPQPPLAGDQLEAAVAAGNGAHHDGLQQTGLTNGGLELVERRGVDVAARLVGVGADVGDRQLHETPLALGFLARGPQQGFEAPAETTATCDGFRHAGTSGSGSAAGGAGGGEVTAPCSTRRISSCATAR